MTKQDPEEINEEQVQQEQDSVAELEALKEKNTELESRWKRALADYQNLERRVSQERILHGQRAVKDVVLTLLPAIDTLTQAAKHIKDEGFSLALKHFDDSLARIGVTKIETVGKKYDPFTMEVIASEAVEDNKKIDIVLEEFRAGYMVADELIRPAQVKVGTKKNNQDTITNDQ